MRQVSSSTFDFKIFVLGVARRTLFVIRALRFRQTFWLFSWKGSVTMVAKTTLRSFSLLGWIWASLDRTKNKDCNTDFTASSAIPGSRQTADITRQRCSATTNSGINSTMNTCLKQSPAALISASLIYSSITKHRPVCKFLGLQLFSTLTIRTLTSHRYVETIKLFSIMKASTRAARSKNCLLVGYSLAYCHCIELSSFISHKFTFW